MVIVTCRVLELLNVLWSQRECVPLFSICIAQDINNREGAGRGDVMVGYFGYFEYFELSARH